MAERIVVQVVVGTAEEIRSGRGECALTTAQAAAKLKLSPTGLRILLDTGVLKPCAKFAKAFLFRESDVDRLVQ